MSETRDRFFCSVESRANREMLCGTVARIRSWLLVEYPNVWRRDAVADSRLFSPAVKAHIGGISVDRTLLVRQEHTSRNPLRAFFVDSQGEHPSVRQHQFREYEELRSLSTESAGEKRDGLMFAVCTHARHDKCCAKFGMPVWCALRDLTPERAWQCSHLGGDRFAANVLVLPYGLYYGRVTPEDVPELVRRSEAGEVWLPGYRGRSAYPRAVQVADYFLRGESGELGINAFRVTAATGSVVEFERRADGSRHRVEFATRPDMFRQKLTCSAEEESPVSRHELISYRLI